jgi:hypothetical protein
MGLGGHGVCLGDEGERGEDEQGSGEGRKLHAVRVHLRWKSFDAKCAKFNAKFREGGCGGAKVVG